VPVLIGVVLGSVIARYAPERLFKIVFVAVAWSAAARLLVGKESWRLGEDLPKGPLMQAYGFVIGLLSTLMGVGGGLFSNLLMTFHSRTIHQSVATSSALAVLISIPGALGYVYAGGGAVSRGRGAAIAVCDRLCLADRRTAGDADRSAGGATRRQGRARDVEADTGNRVRLLFADRRQPVCRQSGVRNLTGGFHDAAVR
jgi:hypothetical protein